MSYNLNGVDKLQLSGETLGGIFSTAIKTWNDPKIAADNPGVTLPNTPIVVAHRSEGSGTTSNFTKYLTKAGGSAWTLGAGDTVNWPASTQGAQANSGVASLIKSTPGAVGYVDLADAVERRPDVCLDQEQLRQVRRADPRRRERGAGRCHGEGRPDL